MRISRPTVILSLAALAWMAWPAVSIQAAGPDVYPVSDNAPCCGMAADQGPCAGEVPADQEPCEESLNIFQQFCCLGKGPICTTYAEAVALQRSNTRSQALFLDRGGETVSLDSKDMNFPIETGLEVGVIRHGCCGWDLEAAYFQIDGWSVDRSVTGVSQMVTDMNGGNFLVDGAQARYTSQIHLGELNLRREWFDGLTILVGFRMGELDEIYSAAGVVAGSFAVADTYAKTFNHLYGCQVGADWQFYNMGGPLTISALCKAGIYGNSATQRSHQASSDNAGTDVTLEATSSQAAFLGEAGMVANYRVTKHLSFRASAQAAWLEGVALSPEQINKTDFTSLAATVDTHGGIFY